MRFQSTKLYDGFSTCFRQWRAEGTACKFLHGYAVSFRVTFEGDLDNRNWVWDFGGMKRASGKIDGMSPKRWFDHMFDHTVFIAQSDPELALFEELDRRKVIQLRVVEHVGAERFAEFLYQKLQPFVDTETSGRVRITKVEVWEHENNSACYEPTE